MRGIISASMMVALKDEGLENAFDEIHGVSAGAINCAYFLAGYGWYGLACYYDDLICKEFLDWGRALRGKTILDMTYVTDILMETLKPLDTGAVITSPVRLHIAASDVGAGAVRDFCEFGSGDRLKTVIKASACLPLVGGPPVEIDGDRFIDGSILLSHPLVQARGAGCTHIVALSTRTAAARKVPTVTHRLIAGRLDRVRRGLGEPYIEALRSYSALRAEVRERSDRHAGPPFVLDVACPEGAHRVSRVTRDRGMLFEGIRAGYDAMMNALGEKPRKAFLRPVLLGE